jgi:TolB-like protein
MTRMRCAGIGWRRAAAALLAALALGGCGSGARLFVNPEADMTFYTKVAVMPFTNLSSERFASARVTRAFMTELIIADRFAVVDPEDLRVALEKIGGEPNIEGQVDPEKVKRAATDLQATGIVRGAVTEYQVTQSGSSQYAVLSFDAEMIDVATGATVWRISISKRGKSRVPVVGGSGTRSFGALTQDACREAVDKLKSEAF